MGAMLNKKLKLKLNKVKMNQFQKYSQSHRILLKNKNSSKEIINLNKPTSRSRTYRENEFFNNMKDIFVLNIKSHFNFKEKLSKHITDKELQISLEMQWDNLNDFERVEFFKTFNP